MQEMKKCKFCGADFLAVKKNHIYCTLKCAQKANRENDKERKREQRAQKRKKKKDTLIEINAAARAAGMTYGQYVAEQYKKTMSFHGGDG